MGNFCGGIRSGRVMFQAFIQGCESCRAQSGSCYPNRDRSRVGITGSVQGYQPYVYDTGTSRQDAYALGEVYRRGKPKSLHHGSCLMRFPEINCIPRSDQVESGSDGFQEKVCNCGGMKSWWLWWIISSILLVSFISKSCMSCICCCWLRPLARASWLQPGLR